MRRFSLLSIFSIFVPSLFNHVHATSMEGASKMLNVRIEKFSNYLSDQPLYTFEGAGSIIGQSIEFDIFRDGNGMRILIGLLLILCSFLIIFFGLIQERKL